MVSSWLRRTSWLTTTRKLTTTQKRNRCSTLKPFAIAQWAALKGRAIATQHNAPLHRHEIIGCRQHAQARHAACLWHMQHVWNWYQRQSSFATSRLCLAAAHPCATSTGALRAAGAASAPLLPLAGAAGVAAGPPARNCAMVLSMKGATDAMRVYTPASDGQGEQVYRVDGGSSGGPGWNKQGQQVHERDAGPAARRDAIAAHPSRKPAASQSTAAHAACKQGNCKDMHAYLAPPAGHSRCQTR